MNDGVTLTGRALARNGAVTLINDTITAAHCAAAPPRQLDVSAPCRPRRRRRQPGPAPEPGRRAGARRGRRRPHARHLDPRRGRRLLDRRWTQRLVDARVLDQATWTADGIAAPWARATWTCARARAATAGVDSTRAELDQVQLVEPPGPVTSRTRRLDSHRERPPGRSRSLRLPLAPQRLPADADVPVRWAFAPRARSSRPSSRCLVAHPLIAAAAVGIFFGFVRDYAAIHSHEIAWWRLRACRAAQPSASPSSSSSVAARTPSR